MLHAHLHLYIALHQTDEWEKPENITKSNAVLEIRKHRRANILLLLFYFSLPVTNCMNLIFDFNMNIKVRVSEAFALQK